MADQSVTDSIPTEALEAAILEAARAYCRDRYDYGGPYATPSGAAEHLERDARALTLERPLRLWVEAAAPGIFAAGRAQAAADIRKLAEKIRAEAWTPSTGIALAAIAEEAARVAEGAGVADQSNAPEEGP